MPTLASLAASPNILQALAGVLPGPVSGYGGGTWNADGSQATAMQPRLPTGPEANARTQPGMTSTAGFPPARLADGSMPARATLGSLAGEAPVSVASMAQPAAQAMRPVTLGDLSNQSKLPQANLKHGPNWGKILTTILGIAGDSISGANGGPRPFTENLLAERRAKREQQYDLEKLNAELEMRRKLALLPKLEQVGSTVGVLDGEHSSFQPIYTAPGTYGQYALDRGFQPGTPEYSKAVEDARMGSWSDPAMQARTLLENLRFTNRDSLQDQRLAVTRRGQDLTHSDRRASIAQSNANNLRSTGVSRENNIRTTGTSRENNAANNSMRFQTSKRPRGAPVRVSTPEEARKLQPGTFFETPDGRILQR